MDRIRLIASDMDATLLDEYSQLPPKFAEDHPRTGRAGHPCLPPPAGDLCTRWKRCSRICWRRSFSLATTAALPAGRGKTCLCPKCLPKGWRQLARSTKQAGDVGLLCGLQAAYAEKQDERIR